MAKDKFIIELEDTEISVLLIAMEKFRDENSFGDKGIKIVNSTLDKINEAMGE